MRAQVMVFDGPRQDVFAALRRMNARALGATPDDCSPRALAFFRALARAQGELRTEVIAAQIGIRPRSLPPLIRAAKQALAASGDSFDRYVDRRTQYEHGRPFSLYRITNEGRSWIEEAS